VTASPGNLTGEPNMRYLVLVMWMLCCSALPASAQVSVSIGINVPLYPNLVRVPGYPVYYAPQVDSNFFFYDGMYWVYQDDNWYASDWYDGPWGLIGPESVPLFVLRIPVRYYRAPPAYFRDWRREAPPRWGDRWGRDWEQRRSGWDRWNHRTAPAPAPLPVYQRQYSGDRYPRQVEQQQTLRNQNYRYQPRAPEVRQRHEVQQAPAQQVPHRTPQADDASQDRTHKPQPAQRSRPPANPAPAAQHEQRAPEPRVKESPPAAERPREEPHREKGPAQDHNKGGDRGR
jgi:hypothetical protein